MHLTTTTTLSSFTGIPEGRRTIEASIVRPIDQALDLYVLCADADPDVCLVGGKLWENEQEVDSELTLFEGTRQACIQWIADFDGVDPEFGITYESLG
jgi:hypothetical protein